MKTDNAKMVHEYASKLFNNVSLMVSIGEIVKHGFAKELLVGIAAAEVDKLAETKGMDFMDKERAKHHAKKQAEHLYDEQYGDLDEYDP